VPASTQTRGMLVTEIIVVVLGVMGPSIGVALMDLASRTVTGRQLSDPFILFMPGHDQLAVALACVYLAIWLAAGLVVVVYVLLRSGETLRTLGLSLTEKRRDLLLLLPVGVLALGLQSLGSHLPQAGVPAGTSYVPIPVPAVYAVTMVARSLQAGILEEVVVLGFLITRLRQLGVHPLLCVVISSLVRGSYHIEYGWATFGPVLFGVGMALVYLRSRRLLPAIAVHAGYDIWVTFQNYRF